MRESEHRNETVALSPIAHIRTGFSAKFGIPRQSGLVDSLTGRIVFLPEYRIPAAVRGLSDFSHIWLIWHFTEAVRDGWRPTVRPPRLGGNTRVGVFATRSPFRPNNLALSCVRLCGIDWEDSEGPVLLVSGVDMLDGTPIFDIKPYIPVADCHPDAAEGYTAETRTHALTVRFDDGLDGVLLPADREAIIGILANDPRPGYDDDPEKEYGLTFNGYDVGFYVEGERVRVFRITALLNE